MTKRSSKCGVRTASPEKDNNNKQQRQQLVFFRYPPKPWHHRVPSSWIRWTEQDLCSRSACVGMWQKKTVNRKRNMNNFLLLQRMQQTSYPFPWPAFQACYCRKRNAVQLNYPGLTRVSYHPETKQSNQKSKPGYFLSLAKTTWRPAFSVSLSKGLELVMNKIVFW